MARNLALAGCGLIAAALLAGCQESRSHTRPQPQYYQTHPPIQQQPGTPQPGMPQGASPQQFGPSGGGSPSLPGGTSSQPGGSPSQPGAGGFGGGTSGGSAGQF